MELDIQRLAPTVLLSILLLGDYGICHADSPADSGNVVAIILLADPNSAETADHQGQDSPIDELTANMDTVALSRVYRRLTEEMLRPPKGNDRPIVVHYVHLSDLTRRTQDRLSDIDDSILLSDRRMLLEKAGFALRSQIIEAIAEQLLRDQHADGFPQVILDRQPEVPEPATFGLFALGAVFLAKRRRTKANKP
jgi:hypothetical protein